LAGPSWQRRKELFQGALTRAPELRGAFLDEACGGDGELRGEVDRLLAAHDAAGAFLSSPIGLDPYGAEEAGSPDARPERIGPYLILDTIARGGMGKHISQPERKGYMRECMPVDIRRVPGVSPAAHMEIRAMQERRRTPGHSICCVVPAGSSHTRIPKSSPSEVISPTPGTLSKASFI
jgi:hypothetical protein